MWHNFASMAALQHSLAHVITVGPAGKLERLAAFVSQHLHSRNFSKKHIALGLGRRGAPRKPPWCSLPSFKEVIERSTERRGNTKRNGVVNGEPLRQKIGWLSARVLEVTIQCRSHKNECHAHALSLCHAAIRYPIHF